MLKLYLDSDLGQSLDVCSWASLISLRKCIWQYRLTVVYLKLLGADKFQNPEILDFWKGNIVHIYIICNNLSRSAKQLVLSQRNILIVIHSEINENYNFTPVQDNSSHQKFLCVRFMKK